MKNRLSRVGCLVGFVGTICLLIYIVWFLFDNTIDFWPAIICFVLMAVGLLSVPQPEDSTSAQVKPKPGQHILDVLYPNPATCTDEAFYKFVLKTETYKLKPFLDSLKRDNVVLKPNFRLAIEKKIKGESYEDCFDLEKEELEDESQNNRIIIELAGVHIGRRKSIIRNTAEDNMPVVLTEEPSNEYDSEAVSVMLMGKKIGYLPSEETHLYHSNKERIKTTTIYAIEEDYDNFLQVYIAIELFSEEEMESVNENEYLRTNKITRQYLYPRKDIADTTHYFYKKKVVITGTFEQFPYRNEMAEMLWEVGADVDLKVTERTDIVIVGENPGWRKTETLLEFQAEAIDEETFLRHFPNYKPKFNF